MDEFCWIPRFSGARPHQTGRPILHGPIGGCSSLPMFMLFLDYCKSRDRRRLGSSPPLPSFPGVPIAGSLGFAAAAFLVPYVPGSVGDRAHRGHARQLRLGLQSQRVSLFRGVRDVWLQPRRTLWRRTLRSRTLALSESRILPSMTRSPTAAPRALPTLGLPSAAGS